jgi:Zn-dependent peptidase ImmA (M78 family)
MNHFQNFFTDGTKGPYVTPHNSNLGVMGGALLICSEASFWTVAHELSHALIDLKRDHHDESFLLGNLSNAKEDYEEVMST